MTIPIMVMFGKNKQINFKTQMTHSMMVRDSEARQIGRRHCLRIQHQGSQRPKFRQELSKFGFQERTVTVLWGPGAFRSL